MEFFILYNKKIKMEKREKLYSPFLVLHAILYAKHKE